jgi:membrane protein DedA with SNARE-associated domain
MSARPTGVVYLVLWAGAALENLVPALPADTFVAVGGFLAGAGALEARWVALGACASNAAGALLVYWISLRYGRAVFERGIGRYLIRPHQMQRMDRFYGRWGTPAIFFSRFLPGIRAIVPIFAGVTHQRWTRVVLPIVASSAIWYGGLVRLGLFVGRDLERLESLLGNVNRTFAVLSFVCVFVAAAWWFRTRTMPHG